MVRLLVDSGAQIDNKDKVSTELCTVLHRDSFLTISIIPSTLSHYLSLPQLFPSLPSPLSPVDLALVIVSLF